MKYKNNLNRRVPGGYNETFKLIFQKIKFLSTFIKEVEEMRKLNLSEYSIILTKCMILFIFVLVGTSLPVRAETINLKANFRLYGEVCRFGIGYGDMALHVGINGPTQQIGTLGFIPGGTSFATGVLEGLSLPPAGFTVIDREFSIPFSLDLDTESSIYVGLGDNGIGGPEGGDIQVIFDFSDNMYFSGSILGYTLDQGLTMTSVTLEDGTPLEDANLKFELIPENTVLTAGASCADACGIIPVQTDSQIAVSAPCGRAIVFHSKATAAAKLQGGFIFCGSGIATDALIDLDVLPEPDPFVFDLAFATVSGNIKLSRILPVPPIANAGENVTITTEEQCDTVIEGTASDGDNDPLQYRWLQGETEVSTWTPVGANGEAYLQLCDVSFDLGQHILTLEVSDGQSTSSDDMILTIDNSAPNIAPTGGGVYSLGAPITVSGQVSDFDGDFLTYTWSEETINYCNGEIQSIEGGVPVSLPECDLPYFELGTHTVTLSVSDGTNELVSRDITIEVVDSNAPTLAPEPNIGILWPPNHKMVDIIIQTNASDDSGLPVGLSAVVTSNEPQEGLGDGDMAPDWTSPVIDQETGVITLKLRSERSGLGDGRMYTVSITANDEAGNVSTANVEIIVPHDQRNNN
jgi:hypothetical protein